MSASAVRAGRAFVELYADNTKLQAGLKRAQAQLRSFASTVNAMGTRMVAASAGILAPLAVAVRSYVNTGDALNEMSARTGMSVEALSRLRLAADYSGSSIEDVENAVRKSGQVIQEAYAGNKNLAAAFGAIGLELGELKSQTPDQMFSSIAKAIANIKNPTDQAYAAFLMFGKSGTMLLPMIQTLAESEARAEKFGATMTTLDASKAAELKDAFTDVWNAIEGLSNVVATTLQPALVSIAEWLAETISNVRAWVSENKGLVVGITFAAVAVGILGVAFLVVGTSAAIAAFAIGGVSAAIGFLSTSFLPLLGFMAGIGAAIFALTKAAGILGGGFKKVKADATTAWEGISAALQSGNIAGAVKVVWAFIKLEFARGIALVMDLAQGFAAGIAKAFLHVGFGINYAFRWAFNKVMDLIQSVGAWILNYFADLAAKIGQYIIEIGLAVGGSGVKGLSSAGYETAEIGAGLVIGATKFKGGVNASVAERKASRDQSLQDFNSLWDEKIQGVNEWLGEKVTAREDNIAQLATELAEASAEMVAAKKKFDEEQKAKADERAGMAKKPLGAIINEAQGIKAETAGMFSAATAFGQGIGSSVAERTARGVEQISKNTKVMADATKSNTSDTFDP